MHRHSLAIVLLALSSAAQAAPAEDIGHWDGVMVAHGAALPVAFDFSAGAKESLAGRFTSLGQAAMDYPLDSVRDDGKGISFVLGGGITFTGARQGDAIAGHFTSEDVSGTFRLHRAPLPALPYATEDVSFRNGAVTLKGTLCLPRGAGRHPAVILLHGSGPETRWGTSRYIADRFARAGIAALIFDKRGSGESGGDWRSVGFDDLARDALAGVAMLAARPEIDPARIGLHGHSQGGAITPLAATLAPGKIAFLIAEDSFAGTQHDQDLYRVGNAIDELHLAPDEKARAMHVYTLFVDAARGAVPMAAFEKAAAPYRKTKWYDWMGIPPDDSWIWPWARKTGNFDTLPLWRQVHAPVLLVYGEKDALVPVDSSIAEIGAALDTAHTPYAALIVPGAQHNLTIQPEPGNHFFWWHQAPGLIDTVVAWAAMQTRR
ncbi:MAG TPA: alpha/beta fold hydrolase [Rhizomicrobium sp.]